MLAKGGALKKPVGASASLISFGFKAPVAMTLSPWFAHLIPHFKLLHVLRDGRDIAFSVNQGPVEKFYRDMYGQERPPLGSTALKAIRLWSDWNSQVHKWALRHCGELSREMAEEARPERSFGYLALHSEDLVSQFLDVRFAAISQLARFVGSSLTSDQLCCVAQRRSEFMGSHDRTEKQKKNSEEQVTKRYGKWRNLVGNQRGLSDQLHEFGREGLRVFGYDPMRSLPEASGSLRGSENVNVCKLTPEDCGVAVEATESAAIEVVPASFAIPGRCNTVIDVDYFGGEENFIQLLLYLLSSHSSYYYLLQR